jgi:hypothetical protein
MSHIALLRDALFCPKGLAPSLQALQPHLRPRLAPVRRTCFVDPWYRHTVHPLSTLLLNFLQVWFILSAPLRYCTIASLDSYTPRVPFPLYSAPLKIHFPISLLPP